ncbi:MAG: hypothetical protein ACK502_08445 [Alphaproteobacteria bacterium]
MNRLSALIWMLVIVAATFVLYSIKYEVQALRAQIAQTSKELEQEREALNVVSAEWEYLNRPERLQALSAKYLATTSTKVEQIAVVEAIPFPKQLQASVSKQEAMAVQPVRFQTDAGVQR